ncbi:hypothetical protein CBOM_04921 [Ceraceosorus bombacis]|uniref:Uncharacterized protein n=1 Tax=Ceraceosorus bombacis TaxID=401625 RepID=A0A0P1BI59_9BASI|nr:hypothetical protein CBOM_04921 [Ceraceosorus bombacis]
MEDHTFVSALVELRSIATRARSISRAPSVGASSTRSTSEILAGPSFVSSPIKTEPGIKPEPGTSTSASTPSPSTPARCTFDAARARLTSSFRASSIGLSSSSLSAQRGQSVPASFRGRFSTPNPRKRPSTPSTPSPKRRRSKSKSGSVAPKTTSALRASSLNPSVLASLGEHRLRSPSLFSIARTRTPSVSPRSVRGSMAPPSTPHRRQASNGNRDAAVGQHSPLARLLGADRSIDLEALEASPSRAAALRRASAAPSSSTNCPTAPPSVLASAHLPTRASASIANADRIDMLDEGYDSSSDGHDFQITSCRTASPTMRSESGLTSLSASPPPDFRTQRSSRQDCVVRISMEGPGGVSLDCQIPISQELAARSAVLRAEFARIPRQIQKRVDELHKRYAW